MRRRWVTALVGTAVVAIGGGGLATPANAAKPSAGQWKCRSAVLHPVMDLTAATTVCARFAQGEWQGKGTVRFSAARRTVSGLVFDYANRQAGGTTQHQQRFVVKPGHDLLLRIGGRQKADTHEVSSSWHVMLVSRPGEPSSIVQSLNSPDVRRSNTATRASTFKGQLPRTCLTKRMTATGAKTVIVSTCLTQRRGNVVVDPITMRRLGGADVTPWASLLIDGKEVAISSLAYSNAPGIPATMVLPGMAVQVLRGEHRAVLKITADNTTSVTSQAVRLRG
jgi:hypothetical protein